MSINNGSNLTLMMRYWSRIIIQDCNLQIRVWIRRSTSSSGPRIWTCAHSIATVRTKRERARAPAQTWTYGKATEDDDHQTCADLSRCHSLFPGRCCFESQPTPRTLSSKEYDCYRCLIFQRKTLPENRFWLVDVFAKKAGGGLKVKQILCSKHVT